MLQKKLEKKRNELLFEIQAQDAVQKLDDNTLYNDVMEEVKPDSGISQTKLNEIFFTKFYSIRTIY